MLVGDLLKDEFFPDFRLVAGSEGLTRKIATVSVLDAPDMDRWTRGGEFLIGSGYIFRDDPEEFTAFIRRVEEKGISAVGIKLDNFLSRFPESLIREAESSRLPLFQIPLRYAWSDIIEVIQSHLWSQKMQNVNRQTERENFSLDDDWDVRRIFASLAREFGREIFVMVPALGIDRRFFPSGQPAEANASNVFLHAPPLREVDFPSRGAIRIFQEERFFEGRDGWFAGYHLHQDVKIDVYLLLDEGERHPSIREERLTLRAINLLRVAAIENVLFSRQTGARKERFLENLCLGTYTNRDIALGRARNLGVSLRFPAAVVQFGAPTDVPLFPWRPPFDFCYALADWWVCIESAGKFESEEGAVLKALAAEKGLWVALGSPAGDILELPGSYEESKRALSWLRKFQPLPGVYRSDELAFHAFLSRVVDLPEAEGLWNRYWRPLVENDTKKRIVSLETVAGMLVRCDFNGKQCAKALHLHYNTFRHYLAEIESLLGISASNRFHRMALSLGCCVDAHKKEK